MLVKLALAEGMELWHTPEGEPWMTCTVDAGPFTHMENWRLDERGGGARRWLSWLYQKETGQHPRSEILRDVLLVLEGYAIWEGEEFPVHLRMALHNGAIYYDLGDEAWRAIRIDADGYGIVRVPPVKFRRPRGMLPLPEPLPMGEGNIGLLRNVIHVTERDWVLLRGFLLGCMHPLGPYQILEVGGEFGSTKSHLCKVVKSLLDPSVELLRSAPKQERDLFIASYNSRVLAFDNLSHIPEWLSDAFCRLSTGAGFSARQLYTDRDEAVTSACLPVMINGITDLATRPDMQSRLIKLQLETLPDSKRRPMRSTGSIKGVWSEWEEVRPAVLAQLCQATSVALGGMLGEKKVMGHSVP